VLIVIRTPTPPVSRSSRLGLDTQVHLAHHNVTSLVTKLVTSNWVSNALLEP